MKRILAAATVAVFITACGSDGGGGSDGNPQGEVADIVIAAAEEAGASPDADCIRENAERIDDGDAAALVEAGLDGDPEISAETGEILADMLLC